ncbi:MAG TPA: AAA family ATPase [Actinomycetota bacterium]
MGSDLSARHHPDYEAEQAYVTHAYERLEIMREQARARAERLYNVERGGTFQNRYERDVTVRTSLARAEQLDIGDLSLVFGRIDREDGERYYIGRRGVFEQDRSPLVVDWRVPAAEPFYRATGRDPMTLVLRRHLTCEGRHLVRIEDERFTDEGEGGGLGLAGTGALIAALEKSRSGSMRDIVATVQAEQDMIIRAPADGVLAVQGGPGTGKTAVALHRAAYLLYTHRAKLERQGVLVVGPNPLFLAYIETVLPALGESGADMTTLAGLLPDTTVTRTDADAVARVKGDVRMARVIKRAVAGRQRPLTKDLTIRLSEHDEIVLRAKRTRTLIRMAKRNRRPHNRRRLMLANILVAELHRQHVERWRRRGDSDAAMSRGPFGALVREHPKFEAALDSMWPALTPELLLSDLFDSAERIESAAGGILPAPERALLKRTADGWSNADVPLLDEAFTHLGRIREGTRVRETDDERDEIATYGHIVVDEVQDLPPMALRMVARRSRAGSMTVVGDLAQTVTGWKPESWDEILRHLPDSGGRARAELTINYRTPSEVMRHAVEVLRATDAAVEPPRSVRDTGQEPRAIEAAGGDVAAAVGRVAHEEADLVGDGRVAVIAPHSLVSGVAEALVWSGATAVPSRETLDLTVSLWEVDAVKGLEFDSVILVEPARLVREHAHGPYALYVALTRTTKRLTVVHAEPLPAELRELEPSGDVREAVAT